MSVSSWLRYIILSVYFITICILFCLPGSAFPNESWMTKIAFDKWVHIGLFSGLCYVAAWAFALESKKGLLRVFLTAVLYGIAVELVQDRWIPNRSLDLGDWAADIVGSFLGIWIWNLRYIKK